MTLKNFFSANYGTLSNYRENMKRRSWVCLLCVMSLILVLPIRHAMEINANLQRMEQDPQYFSATLPLQDMLQQMFLNAISADVLTALVIAGLAVIFAVQGFSWMNQSRKLDLYLSVPVSSGKRFTYIYLNGVWFFALTYLLSMLLTVLIASLMGAGSAKIWGTAMLIWLGNMIFYLACYHLTLIAVMLTGKVLTALCGAAVLFGYEYLLRALFDYLRSTFFRTYSSYSEAASGTLTSPIFTWMESISEGSAWFTGDLTHPDALLQGVGILAVQALVYGWIAWFLYRKRRTEAAGKAMAFGISKPIIKFALVIPAALFVGLWFWELSNESILFAGIGLVTGVLVGHCLIQVIYEADIRSMFRKKWQLGTAGIVSILIFAWFYMDLSGYDSYIPEQNEIEEIAVAFSNDIYTIRLYDNLFEKDMQYQNRTEYMLDHMKSRDADTIDAVRRLALRDRERELKSANYEGGCIPMVIRYGLKNGTEKYRSVIVESEQSVQQMDVVFEDEAFCRTRYQVMDPGFIRNADQIRIVYENGIDSMNYLEDNTELLQVYAEELKSYNFSMIRNDLPLGMLQIRYYPAGTEKADEYFHWGYPVYAGFTETIRLLTGNGAFLEPKENGGYLSPEDVVSLTLTGMNLQEGDMEVDDDGSVAISYTEDRIVVETFSDKKDIEAILPAIYPENLTDIAGNSLTHQLDNANYSVEVAFANKMGHKMQNRHFVIVKEKLPEYIKEKLVYKQETE